MKQINKKILRNSVIIGSLLLGTISINTQVMFAQSATSEVQVSTKLSQQEESKYPLAVMKAVRKHLGIKQNSTALDNQINSMTKIEVMDIYFESKHEKAKGKTIRKVVNDVFNVNLDVISQNNEGNQLSSYPSNIMQGVRVDLNIDPNSTALDEKIMDMSKVEVMDRFLDSYGKTITASESRRIINEIFGVNLNGIDSLEKARLSLYSKGQWMANNSTDIFVLITGKGDIDVRVGVTDYYKEKTATDQLPDEIKDFLSSLGFTYQSSDNTYLYINPTGESVPDSFKGQLIGKLVTYIQVHYANL